MNPLTVGSLFSGIGGFDLGLERAGMRVIWQAETDPFASAVLRKHWPSVPNYGDVRSIRSDTVERPDVVCGGFPWAGSALRRMDDGIPARLDRGRLHTLGNAIVPQIAELIGRAIVECAA